MLKRLIKALKSWFNPKQDAPTPLGRSQPNVRLGDKVGNVTIASQAQLDKHTDFKVGESYRVGEMIVTVRSSKEEVAAIIAASDARRAAKDEVRRERAIELMLMTPDELKKLNIEKWLKERKIVEAKQVNLLKRTFGRLYPKGSYLKNVSVKHEALPPDTTKPAYGEETADKQTVKNKKKIKQSIS